MAQVKFLAPNSELETLRALCHAFASTEQLDTLAQSTSRWVEAVLGSSALASLLVPDALGRLRRIDRSDAFDEIDHRMLRVERKRVFASKVLSRLRVDADVELLLLPLVSRGEAMGLLEVRAPSQFLDPGLPALKALAGLAASVLRNRTQVETFKVFRDQLEAVPRLIGLMATRKSAHEQIQGVVGFLARALRCGAAGWLHSGDRLMLVASAGLTSNSRRRLLENISTKAFPKSLPEKYIEKRFREVTGSGASSAFVVGNAAIVVATERDLADALIEASKYVLKICLDGDGGLAQSKNDGRIQMEISWIAHELRSPVVGARAALDYLLSLKEVPHRHMVEMAQAQLSLLSEYIEPALEWGLGHRATLVKTPLDLSKLVRDAAKATVKVGEKERYIVVSAPHPIWIRADASQLTTAISNVMRSSLLEGPPGTPVDVRVEKSGNQAMVRVMDGRSLSLAHGSPMLFDLSPRDPGLLSSRKGGLGLFLAQRVIHAHGGVVWIDKTASEVVINVQIPAEEGVDE